MKYLLTFLLTVLCVGCVQAMPYSSHYQDRTYHRQGNNTNYVQDKRFRDVAYVIRSEPVYQRNEYCRDTAPNGSSIGTNGQTIIGAVIGAAAGRALGSEVGDENSKRNGAIAGAIAGGVIANDIANNGGVGGYDKTCTLHEQIVAWDIVYEYRGFQSVMRSRAPYRVGDTITVLITIKPEL